MVAHDMNLFDLLYCGEERLLPLVSRWNEDERSGVIFPFVIYLSHWCSFCSIPSFGHARRGMSRYSTFVVFHVCFEFNHVFIDPFSERLAQR
jgi:hypothetical protein